MARAKDIGVPEIIGDAIKEAVGSWLDDHIDELARIHISPNKATREDVIEGIARGMERSMNRRSLPMERLVETGMERSMGGWLHTNKDIIFSQLIADARGEDDPIVSATHQLPNQWEHRLDGDMKKEEATAPKSMEALSEGTRRAWGEYWNAWPMATQQVIMMGIEGAFNHWISLHLEDVVKDVISRVVSKVEVKSESEMVAAKENELWEETVASASGTSLNKARKAAGSAPLPSSHRYHHPVSDEENEGLERALEAIEALPESPRRDLLLGMIREAVSNDD